MKIAIIHDWLITVGGAEKVLSEIVSIYPNADIFTIVDFLSEEDRLIISNKSSKTSFIQNLPYAKTKYRLYLPLMPLAIEQFDLSQYNLIISSSYAVAKGVITGPDQLHICYCHSPIRYAWDMQSQYLKESKMHKGVKSFFSRIILHYIRMWDYRTANSVDHFIANSNYIARRINKIYRRQSTIIYPNVNIEDLKIVEKKENFYLTASRMVPYKKIDLIVKAFSNMPDKKLIVIGDGPQFSKVKKSAAKNTEILGYQNTSTLRHYMQRAKAFIFAAEEDFGIILVEAQACGTPVIAFGKGGALETIKEGVTGYFFSEQTETAIQSAISRFENGPRLYPKSIRCNSERFSNIRFKKEFKEFVEKNYEQFHISLKNLS